MLHVKMFGLHSLRKPNAFCMKQAKYLPTTAPSFFKIPQNLYVTTLARWKEGLSSFRYITASLRGSGGFIKNLMCYVFVFV